ncbi:XRE family transcriptional regulator [Clostridioides difficile]|nr:XRE family transcriptional regulator [Clostridioides difficile]EGT3745269.1 XRE family transcriptional regulator [Clostridioides difficile]EGT3930768.1 XRE family transcriptional regulator [Clostridioides difficile]EGT4069525.1 XRE family transcriptional regulator [Clostridioides difficile]EGT4108067.1 XRE family transcriptional regulator [Clostridioides difficile]
MNMSIKFFKLIDLLNRRGITKEELRLKIGASSTTIAKLSSNKNVSLDVIDKICKALNCQPGDIMEYEDDEKL